MGTVRTVTGSRGEGEDSYSYDVFGSLVSGRLSGSSDYGYLGKQFDKQTGLYNYGYRDYAPQSARFTTVDPIRDGSNWFAYVNNDAVNFVDLWGLCQDKASSRGKRPAYSNSYGNHDVYTPIQNTDTGNEVADIALSLGASTLNLLGGCVNVLSNGVGAAFDLIDSGIDFLDEKIPYEYTLTGNGVRQDLYAMEAVCMTNPQLVAEGLDFLLESTRYLSVARVKTGNVVIDNMKSRIPNNEINTSGCGGDAPISKKDGRPIEIHHLKQQSKGSFAEMHPSDYRYGENYKKNHPNYNSGSNIDRTEYRNLKKSIGKMNGIKDVLEINNGRIQVS